jgi:hypothetical protein
MKATVLTIGLVGVILTASASGGCSGSAGGGSGSDGGTSEGGSGSSSGGAASVGYCAFNVSGVERCVGYGGLTPSDCAAVHGAIVSSCPTGGMAGCCSISPNYEECWYCPSDPSQLQNACNTLRAGQWTAGSSCGDAGGDAGGSSGSSSGGGADAATSPYDTSCTASSMTCPNTGLICQKFSFGGGAINGYACTQTCTSTTDCMAPGDPAVQCLPFTTGSFCVITCSTSCPGALQCVANPGQTGICVSP